MVLFIQIYDLKNGIPNFFEFKFITKFQHTEIQYVEICNKWFKYWESTGIDLLVYVSKSRMYFELL